MLTTNQKGAIVETSFAAAAVKLGLQVYLPVVEGGRYDLMMVDSRTGHEYPVREEALEASAPDLLVLCHEPMPDHGMLKEIVTRIELHAHASGTRVEISGAPYPAEMGAFAEEGWRQQFDKLERVLSA